MANPPPAHTTCVEHPTPWRRHGTRGVKITIIVIQILGIIHGNQPWADPYGSALAVGVGLLLLEILYDAARFVVRSFARLMPERVVLERTKRGRRRLSFGW